VYISGVEQGIHLECKCYRQFIEVQGAATSINILGTLRTGSNLFTLLGECAEIIK